MKTAAHQSILIVEPNEQFREELYNSLLSAGDANITTADSPVCAIDKIPNWQAFTARRGNRKQDVFGGEGRGKCDQDPPETAGHHLRSSGWEQKT
jgi:hypothetical protein